MSAKENIVQSVSGAPYTAWLLAALAVGSLLAVAVFLPVVDCEKCQGIGGSGWGDVLRKLARDYDVPLTEDFLNGPVDPCGRCRGRGKVPFASFLGVGLQEAL